MQPALMLSLECLCLEKNMSGTYNIGMTFSDLYIQILEKEGAAMGEKDIAEAGFIALKDVFADIFNVLIYKGRRVVQENELIELSRTTQYKSDDDELHEQERDVIKKWRGKGINFILLGVENQTKPDKDMPFRIISYDGASYHSQLLEGKERYPVITIVLYFGEKRRWNYSSHLIDSFDLSLSSDDVLREYISDYKINVFDIGAMTFQETSLFQSDFREIAEHFVKIRQGGEYIPSDRIITHVDEFLKLMKILTGDKRYNQLGNILNKCEGGKVSMCRILDEYENRGIQRGMSQGISQGISQGEELMSKLVVKLMQAGRTEELERAAMDSEYRRQLFMEYELI